jgi:hypothetical protein
VCAYSIQNPPTHLAHPPQTAAGGPGRTHSTPRPPLRAQAMSPARATPARVPAAARGRRNEIAGHGPGSVLRARHPTALAGRTRLPARPRAAPLQVDYRLPAGPSTAQRRPRTPTGRSVRSASSRAAPDRRVGRDGSNWISPHGAVHRRITRWVSVSAVPLPSPLGALLGPESAASGRVNALVAVVPADPIARRRIALQYLLNDARARSTVR